MASEREALRALLSAVERVEWSAFDLDNDMALCIECGEGHHDHPDGGGHGLECCLAIAMRMARAALEPDPLSCPRCNHDPAVHKDGRCRYCGGPCAAPSAPPPEPPGCSHHGPGCPDPQPYPPSAPPPVTPGEDKP